MSRRDRYADEDEDRPRKRRKDEPEHEEEIESRLESLIIRVGEKSSKTLETNLEGLASVLDADISSFKGKIIRIICECVVSLPEKTCIYSTLVGLLNARNYNFGGEIVEMLVKNFRDYLKQSKYEQARLSVRFFGDLVNCHVIASASLMTLFENLVDVTMEDNIPQTRADYFVYCVLSALPWVGRELYEKKEQDLEQLFNTIDNYLNKRQKTHHHTALRVWYSDSPHPQEEYLDCIWAQISKLRSDKWIEHHIHRPYLAFDNVLCEALQHNLPQIQPPPHETNFIYPYPRVIFRLFDYTDCPEGPVLPGAHSIERYLIEEHLNWIIERNFTDRKDCAAALLSFPEKHKIPLDYMIVEVVLSQLFALPTSKYLEICHGSLLLELCKLQPSTLPQVLAQSVELLYERLDTMNAACVDRFAVWFAYHLSNFQFRWSWDDWSNCLALDPLHPKPKFIRETLIRCMRLSFHQRIGEIMPDTFQELIPEYPESTNKYEKEGASELPGCMIAHSLMSAFKERCTPEEAMAIVKELPNPLLENEDEPNHHPLKIDVFVTVLLNFASKSFTHCFAAIARFQSSLKELNTSEEAQLCILRAVFEVWHKHQQILVVLIEKLMKAGVIECAAVANWIFSKENSGEFMKSYTWEILHATIKRTIKTVEKHQKELNDAKERMDKMDTKDDGEDNSSDKADNPNEEQIDRMEERLEAAQSDQKNLFLIIFQRFIMLLSEHIQSCEAEGKALRIIGSDGVLEDCSRYSLNMISSSRKITKEFNHKCVIPACKDINMVHILSEGDEENVHFFWCTIQNVPPTIIIAQTDKKSQLDIDWDKLLLKTDKSNAIKFSPPPFNSMAIELTQFYFFNDKDKKGKYDPGYPKEYIDWSNIIWESVKDDVTSNGDSLKIKLTQPKEHTYPNGSLEIILSMENQDGRNDELPHLAYTPLSTSVTINFNKMSLDTIDEFKYARLMNDITIVTQSTAGSTFEKIDKITSIDDEYTPGVFDRLILNMKSKNNSDCSFMEWKPVAYFQSEKIIANTLDVVDQDLDMFNSTIPQESQILNAFYSDSHFINNINVTKLTLTFGSPDDTTRYYGDSKYNTYSMVIGLGSPPEQKLSFLVQMIILVGFGLPLLVMVVSAVYLIVRKIRKRNQDDLLLNQ